jgi:hypothetical protein
MSHINACFGSQIHATELDWPWYPNQNRWTCHSVCKQKRQAWRAYPHGELTTVVLVISYGTSTAQIVYFTPLIFWLSEEKVVFGTLHTTKHSNSILSYWEPLMLLASCPQRMRVSQLLYLLSSTADPSITYSITTGSRSCQKLRHTGINSHMHSHFTRLCAPTRLEVATWIYRGSIIIPRPLSCKFCTHARTHARTRRGGVEPWCIAACHWWHIGGIHALLTDPSMEIFFWFIDHGTAMNLKGSQSSGGKR